VGASARQKLFERHRRVQHSFAPANEVFFHRLCQSRFDPRRQRPKTAFEKPVQQPSLTHEDSLAFALEHPLLPPVQSPLFQHASDLQQICRFGNRRVFNLTSQLPAGESREITPQRCIFRIGEPFVQAQEDPLHVLSGARVLQTKQRRDQVGFAVQTFGGILSLCYEEVSLRRLKSGSTRGGSRFRDLLQEQYPELKFSWKGIDRDIEKNLAAVPEQYEYDGAQLAHRFRMDLCAFTRQLIRVDPQELLPAAQVIQQHRHELEYLADLIHWRLKLRDQKPTKWNTDNPFYWRFALQGRDVPPDTEEHAAGFYERQEYEKAEAIFRLLIDCFGEYAEGYNYLRLIAYQQRKLDQAVSHFEKTMELGRKLFPARMAKKWYWRDHRTRPYMRGLRNLTMTLIEAARFDEALKLCDRLVDECGDDFTAVSYRADIFLNAGKWQPAAEAAHKVGGEMNASEGFVEAFALFELGQIGDALAAFLGAALHYPRAARMLVGLRTPAPKSSEEARDHNTGVGKLRSLHAYLKTQSRRPRKFFSSVVRDPRVVQLLDESIAAVRRWHEDRSGDRSAFDRMKLIQSREFARSEANKLRDLVVPTMTIPGRCNDRVLPGSTATGDLSNLQPLRTCRCSLQVASANSSRSA
jgi:tetratricopeptide (TPR) repeat protein